MIRLLRLLEYEFEDAQTADKHMARFAVPLNGTVQHDKIKIRSAAILDFSVKSTEITIDYDPDAPNLVMDANGKHIGIVTGENMHGVGEVIVQFFDGSADSCLLRELRFPNGRAKCIKWLQEKERL